MSCESEFCPANLLSNKKNCSKIGQLVQKLWRVKDHNLSKLEIEKSATIDFFYNVSLWIVSLFILFSKKKTGLNLLGKVFCDAIKMCDLKITQF